MRLIKYELKKNFLKKSIVIALLIFSVVNVAKIKQIYEKNSYLSHTFDSSLTYRRAYWEIYKEYGGAITVPKIQQLLEKYLSLEVRVADLTADRRNDHPDTYTGNLYSDYYLLGDYYIKSLRYAYNYQENAVKMVQLAKENLAIFKKQKNTYQYRENQAVIKLFAGRKISSFVYGEKYKYYTEYQFSALLVLLLCLYGLSGVFTNEKEADMDTLILTTTGGNRKTLFAKISASMLYMIFICFWFWVLDYLAFGVIFNHFSASEMPLYILENFANTPLNLSLGGYGFLSAGLKTFGVVLFGMLLLVISVRAKRALIPFVCGLILMIGGILGQEAVSGSSRLFLRVVSPFELIASGDLFKTTEFIRIFAQPVLSGIVAVLIALATFLLLLLSLIYLAQKNTVVEGRRKKR